MPMNVAAIQRHQEYLRHYYVKHRDEILARSRANYIKNKKAINEHGRRWRASDHGRAVLLAKKYNVSYGEATRLLAVTACEICGRDNEKLHTDHSHQTGIVRGRLCMRCNRAMGAFDDSPTLLQRVIVYLERHEHLKAEEERKRG